MNESRPIQANRWLNNRAEDSHQPFRRREGPVARVGVEFVEPNGHVGLPEQAALPFTNYEEDLIGQSTLSNFGATPLYQDADIQAAFLALKTVSPAGKRILSLLARSLHWRAKAEAKAGRRRNAAQVVQFVLTAGFKRA